MKKKGRRMIVQKELRKKKLPELADLHQTLSDEWDELSAQQKLVEADMSLVAMEAKARMEADGLTDGSTRGVEFELKPATHYSVADFDKLWKWCLETKRFVFQRRLLTKAIGDYLEAKIRVPGVKAFTETTFKTKRKRERA